MDDFSTILAYLGPETMLPMTSAVAGVAGVLMLVGQGSLRWASKALRSLLPKAKAAKKPGVGSRRIGKGPIGSITQSERRRARS